MTATSPRRRFAFTIATNLSRSALSFVTSLLVARWLGPGQYGDMAFLVGTFAGVRALLDMGSAAAFFTFLSQRPRSKRFVRSYFAWLAVQFVTPLLVVGVLMPSRWISSVWHGQPRGLVVLAFAAAFMQLSVWPVVQQAGESQRRTLWVQGIGVAVVGAHLLAMIVLALTGLLGIYAILGAIAIEYALAAAVAMRGLHFTGEEPDEPEPLLRKFFAYCFPLIPFSAFSFASEFADRWLLQNYGGGVQQAYYAVGAQIASVALIATSSILSIFWKEIAEAHHLGNHARTAMLYTRVTRLLFFVGAFVAGLLIPWSADLLKLLLGSAYVGGAITLMIMLLYPVHQSMGQIGATMMYATERVRIQVLIGIGTMLVGMTTTYVVLAPPTATVPGLGLASTGLAIKMVGTQLLSVNVLAFVISRVFNWRFDWLFQPVALGTCIGAGWLAHGIVSRLIAADLHLALRLSVAAALYTGFVLAVIYSWPGLAGLTRSEIITDVRVVALRLSRLGRA